MEDNKFTRLARSFKFFFFKSVFLITIKRKKCEPFGPTSSWPWDCWALSWASFDRAPLPRHRSAQLAYDLVPLPGTAVPGNLKTGHPRSS